MTESGILHFKVTTVTDTKVVNRFRRDVTLSSCLGFSFLLPLFTISRRSVTNSSSELKGKSEKIQKWKPKVPMGSTEYYVKGKEFVRTQYKHGKRWFYRD